MSDFRFAFFGVVVGLSAAGCSCGSKSGSGDDRIDVDAGGDTDVDTDADTDTGSDTGTGTGSETDTGTLEGPPDTDFVMDSVLYGDDDDGFDLDGHDTESADDVVGCGHIDGPGGIDNQLGPVMQDIDLLTGENSEGLLGDAIEDGILLMLFRLAGLDDRVNDDAVDVHVFNAVDADEIASNNLEGDGEFYISAASVVDRDASQPLVAFGDGTLTEAIFAGGPVDFAVTLPLGPDVLIPITMHDARLTFRLRDHDFVEGVVGGTVPVEEIITAVEGTAYADKVGFIEIILYSQADMDLIAPGPTGVVCLADDDCTRGQDCFDAKAGPCDDGDACECHEPADHCDALSGAVKITGIRAAILGVEPE
jgi:hypothetical protein